MEFLTNKQKTLVFIIGTVITFFIGCYLINKEGKKDYTELEIIEDTEITEFNTGEEEVIDKKIVVHITGEVENEGVIEIEEDARIIDIIEQAGGATEEADLSKINLAYLVKDGQKINIPNINEEKLEEYVTEEAGENVIEESGKINNKVNINEAKQTELETLPGIGPSTALKIINYRQENGEFKTIEDIKNVPGIGESKFENIKESICVN